MHGLKKHVIAVRNRRSSESTISMAQKQPLSMARSVPKFQLAEMLESLSKGDLTAPTRGQPITRSADAGSSKIIPSKTVTALALDSGVEASPVKNPWVGTSRSRREQCAGAAEARTAPKRQAPMGRGSARGQLLYRSFDSCAWR